MDPLTPSPALLAKLGSAVIHADEFMSPNGDIRDLEAFKSLMGDAEVKEWLEAMGEIALITLKR